MKKFGQSLIFWAHRLKAEVFAVSLALRDPRTPWAARVLGALVVAYAFSPIDLIPDFVPVLGYLDDVLIVPLGVWLTVRLIPPEVMAEMRQRAQAERPAHKPLNWWGGVLVFVVWLTLGVGVMLLVYTISWG